MSGQLPISATLLVLLAAVITYYDVRYRRIPNVFVLLALLSGLTMNIWLRGWAGLSDSGRGCLCAFALMLVLHIFGALGAGDVKLFAAIGAILGVQLVLPTFIVVLLTGGMLAILSCLRWGTVRATFQGVLLILVGLLPGYQMPRFALPVNRRQTLPYGVAITLGSLISLALFQA